MPIKLKTSLPGPKSRELMKRRQDSVARGPFHATPIFVESASGAIIKDVDGNELIDFAAGIGVVNTGHRAEPVVAAVHAAADRILHGSFNVTPYAGYVELAEKLNALTPGRFAKKTFLANSGSEAVENAIKAARAYTGRPTVICFDQAFHGRTYMAMTLTAKENPYKTGFAPLCGDVIRIPFPYEYRGVTTDSSMAQLERAVQAADVAAAIVEPVQGEGGFVVAPKEFMQKLREFCTNHKIVLIADEIQTGFGRTGTLFACEQMGIEPDVITLAKGLGGGMPISAVVGRADIMDAPVVGGLGGTYGGNPVACAAALAVIEMFEHGDVLQRARTLGEALESRLSAWSERYSFIGEARGLGPMRAMELVRDKNSKTAWPEAAVAIKKYCYEHGLVTMTAGHYGNVMRLLMPLVIDPAELKEGLDVLEAALDSVEGR
jgi:4-aminobutyrate aminotransferase/(S)-3-amino-2-methylpropionate transaminase